MIVSNPSLKNFNMHLLLLFFAANIPTLILGASIAWNGAYLPLFTTDDSPLIEGKLTDEENCFMAGIGSIGCIVGNILSGWMSETMGRKRTLVLLAIPQLLCWTFLLTSQFIMTVIGRLILGMVAGACFVVAPVFVAEIADDK